MQAMRNQHSVWKQCLSQLTAVLGTESAHQELRWMSKALQQSADHSRANATLPSMVQRRVAGEPLQYILRTQPFGSLELLTRQPVLIPRTETEDWTIRLAKHCPPTAGNPIRLLDLCTGSGCIALLLCKLWPQGTVRACGVDISKDAIQLARDNAKLCDMYTTPPVASDDSPGPQALAKNTFSPLLADIRKPTFIRELESAGLCPPFDVVTSNPPYIPKTEYDNLPTSVREYEDVRALLGDPEHQHADGRGLTFYRDIARLVADPHQGILAPNGIIALEVGRGQAQQVAHIMRHEANLSNIAIWKDPWDVERTVVASR